MYHIFWTTTNGERHTKSFQTERERLFFELRLQDDENVLIINLDEF